MQSFWRLPEEITADILSRLPAKVVGRCRCVSKSWRSLLTRPYFIRTHLDRSVSLQKESLIIVSYFQRALFSAPLYKARQLFDKITISAAKLSFADYTDCWVRVFASCDGLLLVLDKNPKKFILNPVTREIREVAPYPFVCYPGLFSYGLGFGRDSVTNDYRIVAVFYRRVCEQYSDDMDVHVYSLKSGLWRKAASCPYGPAYRYPASGAFVNGCIHWVCSTGSTTSDKYAIVAFDLAEEKFHQVPPPRLVDMNTFGRLGDLNGWHNVCEWSQVGRLGVLDGCLCMFDESEPDIWVMKEYGVADSWTKFTINGLQASSGLRIRPLCMLRQEQVVLRKNTGKLVMYNLRDKKLMDIVVHSAVDGFRADASFVGSLVSPLEEGNETRRE